MSSLYFDHAATTPLRDEVRAAMEPCLHGNFGNPSSIHRWGREAAAALDGARARVAEALGATPGEIFFVRGGTESDNLAVLGRTRRLVVDGHPPRVVVSSVEHKAVLAAADAALHGSDGVPATLRVGVDGSVDHDALADVLARGPCVVSVMWVNNETGMILPVPEIAARVSGSGSTFHTDAVQAVGKIPVRVDQVPVDLLTVTGHKIYGPRGTGVLFVRTGVEVAPLVHGGGQERGLRPGTEDVAGAVGMAEALQLAVLEQEAERTRLAALRDGLESRLGTLVPGLRVNAGDAPRAPHISSLGIPDVDGGILLGALDLEGVGASGGSACDSGAAKASHVLTALYGQADPLAALRLSLGRATTEADVDRAAQVVARVVERIRSGGVDR
ncbi:MAG: cysteine desulfurase [Gemmatimonadota bacterium]|nr:cysteine desulfurase [Gemmatimonadota bacterium]MDH5760901.1 cysteine desulfurase [Gemmatimonadota bacterium]